MSQERETMASLNWLRITCFYLLIGAVCLYGVVWIQIEAKPTPEQFFQRLIERPFPLPSHEELLRVQYQLAGAPAEDVAGTLPAIMQALSHPSNDVRIYAAAALFAVSRRADSANLLRSYIRPISDPFDSDDARLQSTPALIFINLRPQPPPEVVEPLLMYVKRTDPDASAQAGALGTLADLSPENPEVVEAIRAFLLRPLDSKTRINALNALGGKPRLRFTNHAEHQNVVSPAP